MLAKIKRELKKIIKFFIRYPQIENPKLYMTILAKNEEDIIEENLIFHKKMGVDGFIVTDNNSTDKTREIFEKYYKLGWIKEIIDEKSQEYSQIQWVDRMIKIARDKYKADWVINADADEFWYSRNSCLKSEISKSHSNIIKCEIFNVLPESEKKFYYNTKLIKKILNLNEYNLSKFNVFTEQIPKVMHRTKGYKEIQMGNHSVKMFIPLYEKSRDIQIFHYSIRNLKHFKEKMINGGRNVEKNLKLGKQVANHWRYFYEGYKNGSIDLDEEYTRVIGSEYFNEFSEKNVFVENDAVRKILEKELSGEKRC